MICAIIKKRLEPQNKVPFLAGLRILERLQGSGLAERERSAAILGDFAEECADAYIGLAGEPVATPRLRYFHEFRYFVADTD